MPAGKTVAVTVGDRMGDHRAQPADQRLEDRVERQHPGAGDQQVDRQPPPAPDGQHDGGRADQRPQHAAAAQPGDRLDDADHRGVAGHEAVQPGCCAVIGGLERRPLQPYQEQQEREEQRRCGDDGERRESAPGSGSRGHGPRLPIMSGFTRMAGSWPSGDRGRPVPVRHQLVPVRHQSVPRARGPSRLPARRRGSDGYALCIGAEGNAHGTAGFRQPRRTLPGPRGPDRARCHLHPDRLGGGAGRAGPSSREADQQGALQLLAGKSYGLVSLWLLGIGFAAYALWRLARPRSASPASRPRQAPGSSRWPGRSSTRACPT